MEFYFIDQKLASIVLLMQQVQEFTPIAKLNKEAESNLELLKDKKCRARSYSTGYNHTLRYHIELCKMVTQSRYH